MAILSAQFTFSPEQWLMTHTAQHLLDSIPLGIIITTRDGKIESVNASLKSLLGFADKDVEGKGIGWLSVDEKPFGDQSVLKDLAAGKPRGPYIDEFKVKKGKGVPVEV